MAAAERQPNLVIQGHDCLAFLFSKLRRVIETKGGSAKLPQKTARRMCQEAAVGKEMNLIWKGLFLGLRFTILNHKTGGEVGRRPNRVTMFEAG